MWREFPACQEKRYHGRHHLDELPADAHSCYLGLLYQIAQVSIKRKGGPPTAKEAKKVVWDGHRSGII